MQPRDGSLTVYIQREAPEGGKRVSGILAPAEPFFMVGRFCGPEASLIDGSYKIPECKRCRDRNRAAKERSANNWFQWAALGTPPLNLGVMLNALAGLTEILTDTVFDSVCQTSIVQDS